MWLKSREREEDWPEGRHRLDGAQLIGEAAAIENGRHRAFQTVDLVAADAGVAMAAAARRLAVGDPPAGEHRSCAVPYTHLPLPTNHPVLLPVAAHTSNKKTDRT